MPAGHVPLPALPVKKQRSAVSRMPDYPLYAAAEKVRSRNDPQAVNLQQGPAYTLPTLTCTKSWHGKRGVGGAPTSTKLRPLPERSAKELNVEEGRSRQQQHGQQHAKLQADVGGLRRVAAGLKADVAAMAATSTQMLATSLARCVVPPPLFKKLPLLHPTQPHREPHLSRYCQARHTPQQPHHPQHPPRHPALR